MTELPKHVTWLGHLDDVAYILLFQRSFQSSSYFIPFTKHAGELFLLDFPYISLTLHLQGELKLRG